MKYKLKNHSKNLKRPIVILSSKFPRELGAEGLYVYSDKSDDIYPTIVISEKTSNISSTFIHEYIHHTLHEMKKNPELKKLAYRIFKREDFINALAENLSKDLKFSLTPRKIIEVKNETSLD